MMCSCRKGTQGYTAMHEKDEDGNPNYRTFNYELWVCSGCMRPSPGELRRLTEMYAPASAVTILSSLGRSDGTFENRWATPESGERIETVCYQPQMRDEDMMKVDNGRNHLLQIWEKLDGLIDRIRGGEAMPEEIEGLKGQALAYSDVLAQIMHKFYEGREAVLAESMTRWVARQGGAEHESPGLADKYWEPVVGGSRNGGASPVLPPEPAHKELDDNKINFIKHCLSTGAQSPEAMAGMFDVSVEQINSYA